MEPAVGSATPASSRRGIPPLLVVWAAILVAILAAWLVLGRDFRPGDLHPAFLLVVWAAVGLLGVIAGRLDRGERVPRTQWPPGVRETGVEVHVAAVDGVSGEPDEADPRFTRFERREADPPPGLPRPRPPWTFPPLRGRVVVFSLFVGRDGRGWSAAEIAQAHHSLRRAGQWLLGEAARWGAPVRIELAGTFFATEDPVSEDVAIESVSEAYQTGLAEAEESPRLIASASRAAAALGFRDLAHLVEDADRRVRADLTVWIVHLRRQGRSVALTPDLTPLPGVSLAVCYAREESFPAPLHGRDTPDSVTMAHEMLHLFGATDKYGVDLEVFPEGSVTPDDVMVLEHDESLRGLRIDRLTAQEIGWCE